MIRVRNTEKLVNWTGTYLVARGKLILVKTDEIPSKQNQLLCRKGIYLVTDKDLTTRDWDEFRVVNPTIVSETERCVEGDMCLVQDIFSINPKYVISKLIKIENTSGSSKMYIFENGLSTNIGFKKVLVTSDNISHTDKLMMAGLLVLFKLKDQQTVFVECKVDTNYPFADDPTKGKFYVDMKDGFIELKLKEGRLYNPKEVGDKCQDFFQAFCKTYAKEGAIDPLKVVEWFDLYL